VLGCGRDVRLVNLIENLALIHLPFVLFCSSFLLPFKSAGVKDEWWVLVDTRIRPEKQLVGAFVAESAVVPLTECGATEKVSTTP
jgi:hypothetical protein